MNEIDLSLVNQIKSHPELDAVVVEGYDGVGKGRLLEMLSSQLGVIPYRPDYNFWQNFDHRKEDRWKVSGFFWDIYSHFKHEGSKSLMLFDRGVISGAVYNNDLSIASHYHEMLRDSKVLHILVTCEKEDYFKFMKSRNPEVTEEDMQEEWVHYLEYTLKYMEAFLMSGVAFIVYVNSFDAEEDNSDKCKSCGHYNYGICRHPDKNCEVDGEAQRCELANEVEVQDIDSEVYSMQS